MPSNRKPTPAERAKIRAMDRQLAALDAETYRITCVHAVEDKPPINLGKGKGPAGEEKFYTAQQIKQKVGLLSAKNANGYNIYITPIDSRWHYMVIDDLDINRARQFWDWGYRPALFQKSSAESIQAVSILPKAEVSHGAGNVLFKRLNRRIGDPDISGFIHPFRLAGFTNQKPSRRLSNRYQPFVEILRHEHQVDRKAASEAQEVDQEMARAANAAKAPPASNIPVTHEEAGDLEIAAARCWYQRRLEFWNDKADRSKIDRELALRLRKQGYSEGAAQGIIEAVSPNLKARHPRTDDYLRGKTGDLYQSPAEPQRETPRPTPAGVPSPKPR